MKRISGSVTAPRGFRAAGVFCDIKRLDTGKGSAKGRKRDLALIVSDVPAAVAGLFTSNRVCAAPVKVSSKNAAGGSAQAIVVNSGNANACTGQRGFRDAEEMVRFTAKQLGISSRRVLVASTGRIGVTLPLANVRAGIREAAALLSPSRASAAHAAEAIMTSDTRKKEIAVEFTLGGKRVRLGGICKGAGMIQPGMIPDRHLHATMLCFLTTDAAVEPQTLKQLLRRSVVHSFNRISVDGDMSTNDTVLLLANGAAGNAPLTIHRQKEVRKFAKALNFVTLELAKMIVRDGEGVSRFVTVRVQGARNDREAEIAARAVANSELVKTSWNGGDPNWGRIICAVGYSRAVVAEQRVDIGYSVPSSGAIRYVVRDGKPSPAPLSRFRQIVRRREFDVHINLNLGGGRANVYTADLTEAYVDFNKGE